MHLEFTPKMTAFIVSHDGYESTWPFGAWTQLKPENIPTMIGPANMFLESLPKEDQDELARLFRIATEVFEDESQLDDLRAELSIVVCSIIEVLDYERARVFFNGFNGFLIPDDVMDEHSSDYPEVSTYVKREMFDIHVLSVIIKICAPIMGLYLKDVQGDVGDFKEMECLRLFEGSSITETEVWKKLERYTKNVITRKATELTAVSVTHDMSEERLERHAMALIITRRLTIARHVEKGDSIIRYVSRFLNNQIGQMRPGMYRPKQNSGSGGDVEDESVADRYRIPEEVPLSVPAMAETFIEDLDKVCQFMTIPVDPEEVRRLEVKLREGDFSIRNVHLMLIALVTKNIVHTQTLRLLNAESILRLCAASSLCFREMSKPGLSQLVTATQRTRDAMSMNMSEVNTRTFRKLSPNLALQLVDSYPYITDTGKTAKTSNPGYRFIESVVEFCTGYDWDGLENKDDIRDELAKVLIEGFPH